MLAGGPGRYAKPGAVGLFVSASQPLLALIAGMGTLYCGDNLDILRRWLKDEMVDLVYLDPHFR